MRELACRGGNVLSVAKADASASRSGGRCAVASGQFLMRRSSFMSAIDDPSGRVDARPERSKINGTLHVHRHGLRQRYALRRMKTDADKNTGVHVPAGGGSNLLMSGPRSIACDDTLSVRWTCALRWFVRCYRTAKNIPSMSTETARRIGARRQNRGIEYKIVY